MTPREKGALTEARFFAAAEKLLTWDNTFVVSVERSRPELDARGVDGVIRITLPKRVRKRTMSVPVEIKSSWFGVRKWKLVHPEHHKAGVLVFYVPRYMARLDLSRLIYRALTRVRRNCRGGYLYSSWWQRLFARKGSKNLARNIAIIRRSRAHEAHRANRPKRQRY